MIPARHNLFDCVLKKPDLEAKLIAEQQDREGGFNTLEGARLQLRKLEEGDLFLVMTVNSQLLIACLQTTVQAGASRPTALLALMRNANVEEETSQSTTKSGSRF